MKFKKLIFLFLVSVLVSSFAWSQEVNYSVLSIPEDLKKDANDIVRLDYAKMVIKSKKEATLHVKYVVTILNSKSHSNERYISYDKDKRISGLSASIYDSSGNKIKRYDKNDFTDHSALSQSTMYSDSRFKHIVFNHNNYPYTVEIEYKKTFNNLLYYPNCNIQNYNSSVESLIYIVETTPELKIRYKARNIDTEPEIVQSNGRITYKWALSNLSAIKWEEFSPSPDLILPYIDISPKYFQYDKYVGEADTWQSLGSFFYNLREGRDVLSPEMIETVKKLTTGLSTNEEKIDTLYRYLQKNTRYVSVQLGIGGFQPFEAKYVEKNKYGDCKALSNFMLSMLQVADIEAIPGIIYRNDEMRTNVDEEFPTLFGNHMLLYIPSEAIWLECTSNDYPINYLGASNDDRSVLLITKDGGKLVKSPAFKPSDNTQFSNIVIKIESDGSATIKGNIKTKGPKHELLRYFENNSSKEDFEKYFLRSSNLPAFTIEKLEIDSKKESPEAQLSLELAVARYATKAGKRLFIPINKLNAFEYIPSPTEKRIHPIEIIRGYQELDETTFEIPEGFEVESIPNKDLVIETNYGKYILKIENNGSKINFIRKLEIQAANLTAKEFDQFRNFYKEIANADNMKIVLVKKKT